MTTGVVTTGVVTTGVVTTGVVATGVVTTGEFPLRTERPISEFVTISTIAAAR